MLFVFGRKLFTGHGGNERLSLSLVPLVVRFFAAWLLFRMVSSKVLTRREMAVVAAKTEGTMTYCMRFAFFAEPSWWTLEPSLDVHDQKTPRSTDF